jgi:hypothetical protein
MLKQILVSHSFTYDGAQINVYHANKNEGLPRHQHTYGHPLLVIMVHALFVWKAKKKSSTNIQEHLIFPGSKSA